MRIFATRFKLNSDAIAIKQKPILIKFRHLLLYVVSIYVSHVNVKS